MSSNRGKRVHYERGTKGEKSHRHHNSRDSGVGSSSASDRASLGTSPVGDDFSYHQIQNQRLSVTALQEALDAANEQIKQLLRENEKLSLSLAESNKENRAFKKERVGLLTQIEELIGDLNDERRVNEKFKRESSPRTGGAAPAPKTERRTTPPRREEPRPIRRDADERSERSDRSDRSQGSYGRTTYMPTAPTAPPGQNPFLPQSPISTRAPSVSYPPTTVTYAPAQVAYSSAPVYPPAPSPTRSRGFPNDGLYHPYPV